MTTIVGISGSLRRASFNSALLHAAQQLMPINAQLESGSIKDIPLYDGDVEDNGTPAAVQALKNQIIAADALLLVTPEYNNSIPGVLKNTIDWLSRTPDNTPNIFAGKAVAIMGASPGAFGTTLSQVAWLPVLRTLGTKTWFGRKLLVSHANKLFNEAGELTDETVRKQLKDFMQGFTQFIESEKLAVSR